MLDMSHTSGLTPVQKRIDGASPIALGEALKVRLPAAVSALLQHSLPPHTAGTSASSGDSTYQTVFVKSYCNTIEGEVMVYKLTLWVVLALSRADPAGKKSVEQFLSWPEERRRNWIPLPCRPSPVGGVNETPTPTPVSFGPALQLGGWVDPTPQWLCTELVEVTLKETTSFKRFVPTLSLPKEEYARIVRYTNKLEGKTNTPTNAGSVGLCNDDESDDDGESADWEQEGPWLNVIALLAQQHGGIYTEMLQEHFEEERRQKEEHVSRWLGMMA